MRSVFVAAFMLTASCAAISATATNGDFSIDYSGVAGTPRLVTGSYLASEWVGRAVYNNVSFGGGGLEASGVHSLTVQIDLAEDAPSVRYLDYSFYLLSKSVGPLDRHQVDLSLPTIVGDVTVTGLTTGRTLAQYTVSEVWGGGDRISVFLPTLDARVGDFEFERRFKMTFDYEFNRGYYLAASPDTSCASISCMRTLQQEFESVSPQIRVTSVPEPGMWALMASGLAVIGSRTRRKRAR